MTIQTFDALENAERMYSEYTKLSELSDLALLARNEEHKREIVASVSPVMCESYANALLG